MRLLERRWWLFGLIAAPLKAFPFFWRPHVYARVRTPEGPVIDLVVFGRMDKLSHDERQFLIDVADAMKALIAVRPAPVKH